MRILPAIACHVIGLVLSASSLAATFADSQKQTVTLDGKGRVLMKHGDEMQA